MSFSREIKEELSKHIPTGRHCQIAEIAAIISLCGKISVNEKEQHFIKIVTENLTVARKYFMLIKEAFQGDIQIQVKRNRYLKRSNSYALIIKDSQMSMRILKATKLINQQGDIMEEMSIISNRVVQNTCCKRAFIRGAFLAAGSMSDPKRHIILKL